MDTIKLSLFNKFTLCTLMVGGLVMADVKSLYAAPVATPVSRDAICGTLLNYGGQLQILDPSRTRVLDLLAKTPVPCGSWVSVQSGWIQIRHAQGFSVSASAGTFFQLSDFQSGDASRESDHAVLFKGQLYVQLQKDSMEVRVITPNARSRMKAGSSLVTYNPSDEVSQMVVLNQTGTLENRFEGSKRLTLRAGEVSMVGFEPTRAIPSIAKVANIVDLKSRLNAFRLEDQELEGALAGAKKRSERTLAAEIGKPSVNRAPAAMERYERHPTQGDPNLAKVDQKLMQHLVRKVAGGQRKAGDLLYPDEKTLKKEEAAERTRLVKELAKIKLEE